MCAGPPGPEPGQSSWGHRQRTTTTHHGGGSRGDEGWEWSQDGPPLLPISKNNQIIFWPGKRGEYLWAFEVADQWRHVPGGQRVRQLGRNTPQGEDQPRPIARGTQGQLRKVKGEDVWVMAVTGVATAEEEEETEPGEQPKEHVPLQQGQLARVDPDIYRTSRVTPLPMKPRQGDQKGGPPDRQRGGGSQQGHRPNAPQPNYQQGGASSSGHQQPPSLQQQQPHPQSAEIPPATQARPQQSGSRPSDPAPKRKPTTTPPTTPAPPPTPPPPSPPTQPEGTPRTRRQARGQLAAAAEAEEEDNCMVQKSRGRGRGGGRSGGRTSGGRGDRKRKQQPPEEQATKRHKPQLDARARGATTAATYIQAALEALQEHTTGTQATTDAVGRRGAREQQHQTTRQASGTTAAVAHQQP